MDCCRTLGRGQERTAVYVQVVSVGTGSRVNKVLPVCRVVLMRTGPPLGRLTRRVAENVTDTIVVLQQIHWLDTAVVTTAQSFVSAALLDQTCMCRTEHCAVACQQPNCWMHLVMLCAH